MTEPKMIIGIIQEEWRSISGYANYQVSNIGRVRNIKSGRILKPGSDKYSYLLVYLYNKQNRKTCKVHRLVAQEFIDNPDNKTDIDHIDHDPKNNTIKNLRWASKSENHMNKSKLKQQCSSNFKGVSLHKGIQKWRVMINIMEDKTYWGFFIRN